MGLELVREEERFDHRASGGAHIFYRRVPNNIRAQIIKRFQPKRGGDPDWIAVTLSMLRYAVLGWDNVFMDGQPVEYKPELLNYLPSDDVEELSEKVGAGAEQLEKDLRNLKTTSGSSS